ncbi:MAG: atpC [Patescibacteria group bacterium]|jgi:F-type H+-transporting ATPase subunit epsilon|nr:atpC [Patescibacteria group bacterium]
MIALEIITPDGLFFRGEGDEITIPTEDGFIGVRVQHEPLVTLLKKGALTVKMDAGKKESFSVASGFVEISPTKVSVLTRNAKPLDQ